MSEPRGGEQAKSFRDVLTSRAIPEAAQDGGELPPSPPAVPEPPPEGGEAPPAWADFAAGHPEPMMLDEQEGGEPERPAAIPIPNNIMLHGYRTLEPAELEALREVKDLALTLWNTLKQIDQTSAEEGDFLSRPLSHAGAHLEECVLWVEKYFLG
jgi:hypothetical protein